MLSLGERWQFWAEVRFRPLSGKGTGRPTTAPGARASRLQLHIMLWPFRWWDPATCYKGLVDKWDAASSMHQ